MVMNGQKENNSPKRVKNDYILKPPPFSQASSVHAYT